MKAKIYTSESGKKYGITQTGRPAIDDVVYFSQDEILFIQSKRLTSEEFDYCWLVKKIDWQHKIIPEDEKNKALALAKKYLPEIIDILKGKKRVIEEKPDFKALKAGE